MIYQNVNNLWLITKLNSLYNSCDTRNLFGIFLESKIRISADLLSTCILSFPYHIVSLASFTPNYWVSLNNFQFVLLPVWCNRHLIYLEGESSLVLIYLAFVVFIETDTKVCCYHIVPLGTTVPGYCVWYHWIPQYLSTTGYHVTWVPQHHVTCVPVVPLGFCGQSEN